MTLKFLQWYPEWGIEKKNLNYMKGITKFPNHHPPYTFGVPYDGWIDVCEADALRGVLYDEPNKITFKFLDDYDVILTIILGGNIGHTKWLKENYPDKKVIALMEPIPPFWYTGNFHSIMTKADGFSMIQKDVQSADLVLLDSIIYVDSLREMFKSNNIVYCPNPIEVDEIKSFMDLSKRRHNLIGAGCHCNFSDTRQETEKVLIIFNNRDTIERWLFNSNNPDDKKEGAFDKYIPFRLDYKDHLREQNMISVFVDNCTGACSIQSRRCAAMGIPTVGNNQIDSHIQICPDLASDPKNYQVMSDNLTRLIHDESFYKEQVAKTLINIEKYNYNACKDRLFKNMKEFGIID